MTLTKLIEVLRQVCGSGWPAVFQTPDGKVWEIASVTAKQEFSGTGRQACITLVHLTPKK